LGSESQSVPQPLRALLARIFDALRDSEDDARHRELRAEFVFHMTDWITDLERISDLFKNPESWKEADAETFVTGFLYHVSPHIKRAAYLLLDDIPDPFQPASENRPPKSPSP
jgi:hypothetical protein